MIPSTIDVCSTLPPFTSIPAKQDDARGLRKFKCGHLKAPANTFGLKSCRTCHESQQDSIKADRQRRKNVLGLARIVRDRRRYIRLSAINWPADEDVALTLLGGGHPCLMCGSPVQLSGPTCAGHVWHLADIVLRWRACEWGIAPAWAIQTCRASRRRGATRGWSPKKSHHERSLPETMRENG